ncbi:MAG: hypothetical protein Q9174_000508 [Haloplaca sp. 1 TL-2023]
MPRTESKASASSKPQLGESWVVEDGDSSSETSSDTSSEGVQLQDEGRPPVQLSEPAQTPRRRSARVGAQASNVGPELIMPSMHDGPLDGPWSAGAKQQVRRSPRKGSQARPSNHLTMEEIENSPARPKKRRSHSTKSPLFLLKPVAQWLYDVLGATMNSLKTPLSYFLAMYLFVGLLILLRNFATTSIYSALSPICRIPGSSLLNLPMCHSQISQAPVTSEAPVEFERLINVQSHFEAILEESAGGVTLPLDMKRSETSLRDLRTIIRYGNLPSKNELVFEFNGFIETAGIASSDLQKFNSHVGRAVDNILATARWTKRVLDGVATEHESRGLIPSFLTHTLLAPFQPIKFTEATILGQYTEHTRLVEAEINRLIDEAQALLLVLRNLDDRLDVIHGVAIRDDKNAHISKEEIMSQLWTMLGGNRKALGKLDSQIKLLGQVNVYRQTAIAHVAGTMLKLQAMGAELEELRERVGTVELVGGTKGVPLSVHIESIELGVERLEQRRNWARGIENEHLRRALDRDATGTGGRELGAD